VLLYCENLVLINRAVFGNLQPSFKLDDDYTELEQDISARLPEIVSAVNQQIFKAGQDPPSEAPIHYDASYLANYTKDKDQSIDDKRQKSDTDDSDDSNDDEVDTESCSESNGDDTSSVVPGTGHILKKEYIRRASLPHEIEQQPLPIKTSSAQNKPIAKDDTPLPKDFQPISLQDPLLKIGDPLLDLDEDRRVPIEPRKRPRSPVLRRYESTRSSNASFWTARSSRSSAATYYSARDSTTSSMAINDSARSSYATYIPLRDRTANTGPMSSSRFVLHLPHKYIIPLNLTQKTAQGQNGPKASG
jgi:hypothetical protein